MKLAADKFAPFVRSPEKTSTLMLDVIIALMPAFAASCYVFGTRSAVICLISVISCLFFEWFYCKIVHKAPTVYDLSAAVTGLLIAFCLPVSVPIWLPILAGAFAIIVVKQLYGGIGKNFLNPALAARAFLVSCFPAEMTNWSAPHQKISLFSGKFDAVTSATPLSFLKTGKFPDVSLGALLTGDVAGCIGETSAVCLIIGGIYLVLRRVISPAAPLAFVLTVGIIAALFPQGNPPLTYALYEILSGGVLLGAIFMATDYVTSPVTLKGRIFFGIGCGAITMLIRVFGGYPEGVCYSILLMNLLVLPLDRICSPRIFGHFKNKGGAENDKK